MYEINHQSLGDDITDNLATRWFKGLFSSDKPEETQVVYDENVYFGPPAPPTTITAPAIVSNPKPKPVPVAPSIPGSPVSSSGGNMLNWIIGGGVLVMGGFATWLLWPKIKQSFKGKKG